MDCSSIPDDLDRPPGDPTPQEIAELCRVIRRSWSEAERLARGYCDHVAIESPYAGLRVVSDLHSIRLVCPSNFKQQRARYPR